MSDMTEASKQHDGIREGEIQGMMPDQFDASVYFIGRIHTPCQTRAECPRRGDP